VATAGETQGLKIPRPFKFSSYPHEANSILSSRTILESNGSAVDAAIAALLCNGLVNAHSMGIGGGFFMTIYSAAEKRGFVLNAREAAPAAAKVGMFETAKEAQLGKQMNWNRETP